MEDPPFLATQSANKTYDQWCSGRSRGGDGVPPVFQEKDTLTFPILWFSFSAKRRLHFFLGVPHFYFKTKPPNKADILALNGLILYRPTQFFVLNSACIQQMRNKRPRLKPWISTSLLN